MTVKRIANCNNVNSVIPLYLMIDKMIGHFEEKNGYKYLILDDVNENKEVSKKYEEIWNGIKKELKQLMVVKKMNMGKIFKKIRFKSNDYLLLNKPIKLHLLTIIIRSAF